MLIADFRHHIQTSYVIPHEFVALCAGNMQAYNLLGYLFWWTDWVETHEPHRHGWTYQTAENLLAGLQLTRRGYQKAREALLELGVLQYRRSGVFGKMHWKLNKEKLLEMVYQVRGQEPPEWTTKYQHDSDNFRLPKWVPLDLWNAYLQMCSEKGRIIKLQGKKTLLKQLIDCRAKGLDLRPIMEKSIIAGSARFYIPNGQNKPQAPAPSPQKTADELKQAQAEREAANAKPPDKNPDNAKRKALQEHLKTLKNLLK